MNPEGELRGDQSWRKNRRWASGRIPDQSSTFIFCSVLFTVIINAIAWLAMLAAWRDYGNEPALLVFASILVCLGLALLAWSIRQIRIRLRFGRSVFEMETLPGAIGGWLAGTIRAPVIFNAPRGIRLELECVARVPSRRSNGTASGREQVLLEGKQSLGRHLPREGGCTCIPVAFEIPPDAKPSGREGNTPIFWRLRARASQDGADYDASFIVPVFRVSGTITAMPRAETAAAPLRTARTRLAPQD